MRIEQALELARDGHRVRLPVWPAEQFLYWTADSGPVISDPSNGTRRLEFVPTQMWTSQDWTVLNPEKIPGG